MSWIQPSSTMSFSPVGLILQVPTLSSDMLSAKMVDNSTLMQCYISAESKRQQYLCPAPMIASKPSSCILQHYVWHERTNLLLLFLMHLPKLSMPTWTHHLSPQLVLLRHLMLFLLTMALLLMLRFSCTPLRLIVPSWFHHGCTDRCISWILPL